MYGFNALNQDSRRSLVRPMLALTAVDTRVRTGYLFVCEGCAMTAVDKPLPDCFTFMLAKAYQRAHGHFRKALEPFGVTNIQHAVLEALWYRDGQTATELGQMLVLDKATLSGVLARMQESGWVERHADPDDGRVMRIFSSPRANAVKDELIAAREASDREILSRFSLEERLLLKRLLMALMEE
jgi:DNA-binding MarR family transcriptional regulator